MNDKLIIGITGHKQSGKDTVAGMLTPLLSKHRKVLVYHIGNTIAATLAQLTGGKVDTIISNKNNPYIRGCLQFLGAERRMVEGADCFINDAQELINTVIVKSFILIPSIRFVNEYRWIKDNKGLVIRIFRPEADNNDDPHPTETEISKIPFDHSVINDANMGRLENYVKFLADTIIAYANRI